MKPLYKPHKRPMNLVCFGSGSGTNIKALLKEEGLYKIRALVTDRNCPILKIGEDRNIPTLYVSFSRFFEGKDKKDSKLREAYDQKIVDGLRELEKQHHFKTDLIFLAGYMRVIHAPLLNHFTIVNIHPADLTILNKKGERLYRGAHAIKDALMNGEKRTRSTVHLVTEELDGGPIILQGPWVPYEEIGPITESRVQAHQEKHKHYSDWPASIEAVKLISEGKVGIEEGGSICVESWV